MAHPKFVFAQPDPAVKKFLDAIQAWALARPYNRNEVRQWAVANDKEMDAISANMLFDLTARMIVLFHTEGCSPEELSGAFEDVRDSMLSLDAFVKLQSDAMDDNGAGNE